MVLFPGAGAGVGWGKCGFIQRRCGDWGEGGRARRRKAWEQWGGGGEHGENCGRGGMGLLDCGTTGRDWLDLVGGGGGERGDA